MTAQDQYTLELLSQCGRPWAEQRAQMALAILQQYQGGGLDQSEYMELMQDLVRSDRLDAEADDLETKAALVTAVYACAQLI